VLWNWAGLGVSFPARGPALTAALIGIRAGIARAVSLGGGFNGLREPKLIQGHLRYHTELGRKNRKCARNTYPRSLNREWQPGAFRSLNRGGLEGRETP
jgi:hypothetical protein